MYFPNNVRIPLNSGCGCVRIAEGRGEFICSESTERILIFWIPDWAFIIKSGSIILPKIILNASIMWFSKFRLIDSFFPVTVRCRPFSNFLKRNSNWFALNLNLLKCFPLSPRSSNSLTGMSYSPNKYKFSILTSLWGHSLWWDGRFGGRWTTNAWLLSQYWRPWICRRHLLSPTEPHELVGTSAC